MARYVESLLTPKDPDYNPNPIKSYSITFNRKKLETKKLEWTSFDTPLTCDPNKAGLKKIETHECVRDIMVNNILDGGCPLEGQAEHVCSYDKDKLVALIQELEEYLTQKLQAKQDSVEDKVVLEAEIKSKMKQLKLQLTPKTSKKLDKNDKTFLTLEKQIKVIDYYFIKGKTKRWIYQNHGFTKYEVDHIVNSFKKTGNFALKKDKKRRIVLPELDQMKEKLNKRFFMHGCLGKTVKEVAEYMRRDFKQELGDFGLPAIQRHLRKSLKLRKMRTGKRSTKVDIVK